MKILELEDDLAVLYVKLKYPDKLVVILYGVLDTEYLDEFLELFDLNVHQIKQYILIDFEKRNDDAINFCNSLDGDYPYYVVVDQGCVIFENMVDVLD